MGVSSAVKGRQVKMLLHFWIVPAVFLLLASCVSIDISFPGNGDETPAVKINDGRFEVEVADTPRLRARGLRGRPYLPEREGMLYIPDGPVAGPFWTKGMQFPLDFIWVGRDCRVVDLATYVDAHRPGTPDNDIPRYRSYPIAAYALEVNAGEVDRFRIRVGDKVKFENVDVRC